MGGEGKGGALKEGGLRGGRGSMPPILILEQTGEEGQGRMKKREGATTGQAKRKDNEIIFRKCKCLIPVRKIFLLKHLGSQEKNCNQDWPNNQPGYSKEGNSYKEPN